MSCPIKDTNEVIRSYNLEDGHHGRASNSSFWLPHLYLLLDITLSAIHIPASDYLICIFYWTLHWPSFTFQLLITSFVSFIGHYIDRHSNCSFWLPHFYLLLDITLGVIHIPASDYLSCIFYWTLHWLSFTFQLLITSFVSFIGHYIGRPSNSSLWLPHLFKRYKWGNQKLECEGRPM
jgi:uncharacterized membrane protein